MFTRGASHNSLHLETVWTTLHRKIYILILLMLLLLLLLPKLHLMFSFL